MGECESCCSLKDKRTIEIKDENAKGLSLLAIVSFPGRTWTKFSKPSKVGNYFKHTETVSRAIAKLLGECESGSSLKDKRTIEIKDENAKGLRFLATVSFPFDNISE